MSTGSGRLPRRRGAIDAYFRRERRANSNLWNGRLLLVRDMSIGDGALRVWDRMAPSSLAGWRLTPEMPGKIYFPSGSFDRKDVTAGKLDVLASVLRELRGETGLAPEGLGPDLGWHAVFSGPRRLKVVRAAEPADVVRSRIVTNLASQKKPEFVAIEVVRSGDVDPRMPLRMQAFLRHVSDVFG